MPVLVSHRRAGRRRGSLTEGLIRRKYSDAHIEGILGANFSRVLSQIWRR